MKIPFVKVNNQQEFERVIEKMQRETGLKLWEGTNFYGEWNVLSESNGELALYRSKYCKDKIISADEYLTEIRTNFTLSDLEDGMVVELRNGRRFIRLNNSLVGIGSWANLRYFSDFTDEPYNNMNIIKIYRPISYDKTFENLLKDDNLTLIFDAEAHRNKLAIEQKKADIRHKIYELKLQLEELK